MTSHVSSQSLKDLSFNACLQGASSEEVEVCTKLLHSLYSEENHYRYIQPSEAYTDYGSIETVLQGIRPLGSIQAAPTSAYVLALKTIPGIQVVQSKLDSQATMFYVVRKGAAKELQSCLELDTRMQKRVAKEGVTNPIMAIKRMMDFGQYYGKAYNYHPDAIAAFAIRLTEKLKEYEENKSLSK